MKRLFFLIFLLLFSTPVFSADEVITDFESGSVTILNEELRKISEDIQTTSDSIAPAIAAAAVSAASTAEVKTGTEAAKYVAPSTMIGHEGVIKAWCVFDGTAGSPSCADSYNVTSITDNGTGNYTLNFTTAFESSNYACVVSVGTGNTDWRQGKTGTFAAGSVQILTGSTSSGAENEPSISVICIGDR